MRECQCRPPRTPTPKANHPSSCICGFEISERWKSSDEAIVRFFNRLSDSPLLHATFPAFRQMCEKREMAGREKFGYEYLRRDNLAEAVEEASDLALYMYLDQLKAERDGIDPHADLAYQVAFHAAEAFDALARLAEKRRGAP